MDLNIRKYDERDTAALAKLFYETVHAVCAGDYTAAQLSCWADGRPDLGAWKESLSAHISYVAESCGIAVWHIEVPEELPLEALKPYGFIGLTAGASTPRSIIDAVQESLKTL